MNRIILSFVLLFALSTGAVSQENQTRSRSEKITDEQLSPMNRTQMKDFYELNNSKKGKPYRILILGNSIGRHGKAESIGWLADDRGMAATKAENDYVHLLFRQMEGLLPDRKLILRETSIVKFEREFPTFDLTTLDPMISFQPDLIIFQLGENTGFNEVNTPALFQNKYIEMINRFKKGRKPLIICTTPFFPSAKKNEVIEQVALETKSYVADLSHLPLLDSQNYAKDEVNYAGDKSVWKVSGIGIHPGDYGMRNIAQQLFIIINAAIK